MIGIKYLDKVLAKELGVKIKELTIDMIDDYIDRKEREATSCASSMQKGSRVNLGILRFLPYKEELEIRQYILNWSG
ncbi:hypothetical protein HYT26_03100 [Candidatus Pacearchaeota archaeon]|nr:hypothetical protein [Candidatus Pacearchaeota archaeon]